MATELSVMKAALPLKLVRVEEWEVRTQTVEKYAEEHERTAIYVHARPYVVCQCMCPECMKKCPKDGHKRAEESTWRASDLNGVPVYIKYRPQRILCA